MAPSHLQTHHNYINFLFIWICGLFVSGNSEYLPKQGSMLQVSIPTLSPSQGRPPEAGGGLVPERYLLRTPTSHVRLHALHRVQLLQPQSTEKHKHKIEGGDGGEICKIHHIRLYPCRVSGESRRVQTDE